MSLYESIFKGAPNTAAIVVGILTETHVAPVSGFVRSRDGMLEERDGKPVLRLHTRSGGGNRDCYCEHPETHDDDGACIAQGNEWLEAHPWYLFDEDSDFDYTYADFYFKVPDDYEDYALFEAAMGGHVDIQAQWQAALDAISKGST